ncbi:hypothetical protein BU26DRAFT_511338 [Trematosphaeria pertusa]|uniref:DUF8021 domain-containing protein n=1 Tax=Trematosphaeria pertusa TaxID=390896 RepID=A0A6A6HUF0_9PLEO|nr:uncharacterized protein BU26DRAFT_511338 [Trematosphaeria pertusa]KAF2241549.1 hypothetical protein BU26DRAFT_511338 [Trematosphaeria pertusa]
MKASIHFAISALAALTAGQTPSPPPCDRPCLETLVSDYLTALIAHDPSRLPLAPDVKYVENSQIVPLGTGEWHVATSLGRYRHIFSDPENGQVGAITTLTENGVGIIYVVRLKREAASGLISEIESQITRDAGGFALYENMSVPESVWLQPVAVEDRIPRAKLISQTDKYYAGMERNDPRGNYSFFDRDCNRLEDGLQTTNQKNNASYGHSNDTAFASLGCEAQFQTGFLGFVTRVRDRRYAVVDEERQAVLAMTIFDHNGTVRELPSVNGTSNPIPPYFDVPRTLAASEAFRLRGEEGKLWRIEMTLTEVPYGQRTAFDAGETHDLSGRGTNRSTSAPCDRACLDTLLDNVLAAMLRNDTTSLPLAKGVRYSENGQFLALGDGLWETLQHAAKPGVDDYAARFADPSTQTAGYWGLTREQSTPGVLALRITLANGQISEIEALSVRAEGTGARGGTVTLMRPPLPVEWVGDSLGALDAVFKTNSTGGAVIPPSVVLTAYFNGLEQHSSADVPFTPSCTRRDMGRQLRMACGAQMDGQGTTPNGLFNSTGVVRDRRVLVADASKGVAMVVAMVDYPARVSGTVPRTQMVPSTYMIPQLIKMDNGTISRVEGMIKWMPFGYTSAWAEGKSNSTRLRLH